jgi:uncharacterized hydrophobic protein (TIGR00271 family)
VINVEVFGETPTMERVAASMDGNAEIRRVRLTKAIREGHAVVAATVSADAVDELLDDLRGHGVPNSGITLTRAEVIGASSADADQAGFAASLVWEDVLGMAARSSRPIARYLAFMFVAGIIGGYGVLDYNVILIVGAMAISPDLLPITAVGIGLVDRRLGLAWRAVVTLVVGMAVTAGAAASSTFVQHHLGLIPSKFNIDSTVLGSLDSVNNETVVVALAAGVAGMLALETRASSGVGVAVSVTTIPAAAYLGVALGLAESGNAGGAFEVLSLNVAMLVLASSATLIAQRRLQRTARRRREIRKRISVHPHRTM